MDVCYRQFNSGRLIANRQEPEALKAELLDVCANRQEWTLDTTVYQVKGVRISPETKPPQTMLVALEYVRDVMAGYSDC